MQVVLQGLSTNCELESDFFIGKISPKNEKIFFLKK
jgi:hypothetical protein